MEIKHLEAKRLLVTSRGQRAKKKKKSTHAT